MGRRKNFPIFKNIEILDIAAEGKAIAKTDDIVIFVDGVITGDVVDIQITKKRSRYYEGRVLQIVKESGFRTKPFCSHFGTCGGCKWQMLPYEKQLESKQKQVNDQLVRIGKLEIENTLPIKASENTQYYRNKLEFTFSNKRWKTVEEIQHNQEITQNNAVGFHIPGMFDKILDITECFLQQEPSNAIRNFIREYALQNNLTFFDIRNKGGLLRNIIVRNTSIGELMLIVVFYENLSNEINALMTELKNKFPEITSLLYVINQKANDTIHDQIIHTFSGKSFITENMEDLQFTIGPKSFFQTNSIQAYELYKITREFAQLSENDLVYDLYTGTGTIANFVAKKCKQVIGIEYVPEAIEDAKLNSEKNNIQNSLFFAGDMKDILNNEFISQYGKPDVIITDPPRAGMHEDVIKSILFCDPKRIVYVSCNPATQARDIALMREFYTVKKSQAVDMFPHTHHVENVVLLERK